MSSDTDSTKGRKLEVAIFLMQGMWTHDLANALQVFGVPFSKSDGGPLDPCRITLLSCDETIELDHGLSAQAQSFSNYDVLPDVICVPGFADPFHVGDELLQPVCAERYREGIAWLRSMHARGVDIGAMGSGPFVLAWAGLLDDTYCTVHRRWKEYFKSFCESCGAHPKFRFGQLMVHDVEHRIWSCGGGVTGLDLCLSLLMEHTGRSFAYDVSRVANIWSPRSLDTQQDALGLPRASSQDRTGREIAELRVEVRRHPERSWSIDEMAWYVGMSSRTFQRQFHRQMGQTPGRWLVSERLSVASELLKSTDLSVAEVAERVGMGGAGLLRRHFSAVFGETPAAFRKRMQERR